MEDDIETRFTQYNTGAELEREERRGEVHPDFFLVNIQLMDRIYRDIQIIGRRLEEKRKNQIKQATKASKAAQAAAKKEKEERQAAAEAQAKEEEEKKEAQQSTQDSFVPETPMRKDSDSSGLSARSDPELPMPALSPPKEEKPKDTPEEPFDFEAALKDTVEEIGARINTRFRTSY